MDSLIEALFEERPSFHRSETEIDRTFEPSESFVSLQEARSLASQGLTCYGIGRNVAQFVSDKIDSASRTLETGAGISTLVFAIKGANHIAVTPDKGEIEAIQQYAKKNSISLDTVRFIAEPSDRFLPNANIEGLDMVFLDGKHAFP